MPKQQSRRDQGEKLHRAEMCKDSNCSSPSCLRLQITPAPAPDSVLVGAK